MSLSDGVKKWTVLLALSGISAVSAFVAVRVIGIPWWYVIGVPTAILIFISWLVDRKGSPAKEVKQDDWRILP